jgi:hypothetical protein
LRAPLRRNPQPSGPAAKRRREKSAGVGVALKVSYGVTRRPNEFFAVGPDWAVFFSALMTASAFGSLWFSSHPGTSMGKLLALITVYLLRKSPFDSANDGHAIDSMKAFPLPVKMTTRLSFAAVASLLVKF